MYSFGLHNRTTFACRDTTVHVCLWNSQQSAHAIFFQTVVHEFRPMWLLSSVDWSLVGNRGAVQYKVSLILNFREISFPYDICCGYPIVLNICTEYGSDTAMLCA